MDAANAANLSGYLANLDAVPVEEADQPVSLAQAAYEKMIADGLVEGEFEPWAALPEVSRQSFDARAEGIRDSRVTAPFETCVRELLGLDPPPPLKEVPAAA